ncbi:uncharacterized protein [Haliotis cracherodii]|uniref:uncharacterized protein n=1 Tax=Haliotis cracherodii TaxID=6455 RepID=UPI0039EBEE5E
MLSVLVFILSITGAWCALNLLQDGDFEAGNLTRAWSCSSCDMTLTPDSHTGGQSVKVLNRKFKYSGPAQVVPVQPGHRYSFTAYIKLLNQLPGHLYHGVNIMIDIVHTNGKHHYDNMGKSPHIQLGTGWHLIGGDYLIPNDTKTFKVYIEIDQPQVNYLLDSATFEEVLPLHNFRSAADDRIEKLRKANVTIKLAGAHIDPTGLTVDLEQTYSEFIIASAIDAKMIVDPSYKKYQDFFYQNFEWGLPSNALKWIGTEHVEGHPHYSVPFAAVDALLKHGKKVKGHNIFWDVKKFVPTWQYNKSATDLKSLMAKRIQEVVGGLKGKLQHWDVNNENLHGDFYEQKLKDPNITMWMFRETHKADPAAKLFLNDYNIVNSHYDTFAFLDQATTFKKSGVPVGGIGIQSHMTPPVDIAAVKFRLDQVAKAGLPIVITELDVDTADEQEKARIYEDLYRLYYSHPAVEGVVQWHFWSGRTWKPEAVLAEGPNITANAAGRIVRQLVWGDWRTNQTLPISHDRDLHVRAFKGEYKLRVKHHGKVIREEDFTLGQAGVDLTVSLSGSGTSPQVSQVIIG